MGVQIIENHNNFLGIWIEFIGNNPRDYACGAGRRLRLAETKLYLSVPLPPSPAEANLYLLQEEQLATVDMALAKAQQLGVQGEVFEVLGRSADQTGYMVTDGMQRMYV